MKIKIYFTNDIIDNYVLDKFKLCLEQWYTLR